MRDKHLNLTSSLLANLFHGILYVVIFAYVLFEPLNFVYKLSLIVLLLLIICLHGVWNKFWQLKVTALSLKSGQWFLLEGNNSEQPVRLTGKSRVLGIWTILHLAFEFERRLPICIVVWPDAMSVEDFAFLRRYLLLAHKPQNKKLRG